jgi:hypothetical protein
VIRSAPQIVAMAAAAVGIVFFVLTLYYIDLEETAASAGRLGVALPIILLPSVCWHILRTWGWAVAFPDESRPTFSRLFRVRLAADAVGFFTIRGLAGASSCAGLGRQRRFFAGLSSAVLVERLDGGLRLLDARGRVVARFSPAAAGP